MKINGDQLNKWNHNSQSWVKILYIVKIPIFPKLIYRWKTIPATFFGENSKMNSIIYRQCKEPIVEAILIKKKLPYIKISIIKLQ